MIDIFSRRSCRKLLQLSYSTMSREDCKCLFTFKLLTGVFNGLFIHCSITINMSEVSRPLLIMDCIYIGDV